MAEAVYDETSIEVAAKGSALSGRHYLLRASGQILKFEGWRRLFPQKTNEDGVVLLPPVNTSDHLDLIKVLSEQKFTQPPARYNEASIIKTLEKLGIGRPSTYAPTISTIQARGYIEKNEGKFSPTSVGIAVNDFLIKNFTDVFEYSFTASMEDNLDKVADGKLDWHKEIGNFWKPFVKQILSVDKTAERVKIATEKVGRACPECKEGELVIRQGRFGKFISCARFPECKYTEKIVFKIDMKCPKCEQGDVVMKKTKKGRSFFGCSRYPECDFASWKKPTADTVGTETPKLVEPEE
jgi:DNA topoisomerase-1